MSELFTFIDLPGTGNSFAERGNKTVKDMIKILREHAAYEIKKAQEVLAASDGDFHVLTARGILVMRDRKVLQKGRKP